MHTSRRIALNLNEERSIARPVRPATARRIPVVAGLIAIGALGALAACLRDGTTARTGHRSAWSLWSTFSFASVLSIGSACSCTQRRQLRLNPECGQHRKHPECGQQWKHSRRGPFSQEVSKVKQHLRGDMRKNEAEIRSLIERWAKAVHAGDLEGVLADHARDIVMFDVPPPETGVRGIDAYRETWPPSSSGRPRAPNSRSWNSMSPPARTLPLRTPCSDAARLRSFARIPTTAFVSRSDCARKTSAGALPTSITHFPQKIEGAEMQCPALRPGVHCTSARPRRCCGDVA